MNSFEIEEVWISSIDHLEQMHRYYEKFGMWKLLLGLKKIDPNFPQLRTGGFVSPIVFFSMGKLKVDADKIEFEAELKTDNPKVVYNNVQLYLNFIINIDQIEDVTVYKFPKPYLKKFNYPWVLISLKNRSPILICSKMQFGQIENGLKQTAKLYEYLQNYVA